MDKGTVIVTGANTGIGLACVNELFSAGYDVVALVHTPRPEVSAHFATLNATRHNAITEFSCDLTDYSAVKDIVTKLRHRSLVGLVNNAGSLPQEKLFVMTPLSDIEHYFKVNCLSAIHLTQLIVRLMMRDKDNKPKSIVMVSSINALDGYGPVEYALSKGALITLATKLARELQSSNIRVNSVCPGLTATSFNPEIPAELERQMQSRSISHAYLKPEQVASTIVYLLSPASSGINGQCLQVRN